MRLSFNQKLWLPLILSLICLSGVSVYSASQARAIRLEERKENLIQATAIAISVVRSYADQAASGELSVADAKMEALERIRKMRYGDDGYFVVFDQRAIVVHPTRPKMIGLDVGAVKDPAGVPFLKNMISIVDQSSKSFTSFLFPKPGASQSVPKIAYAELYANWGWIFTTGVYVDDIDNAFSSALYERGGVLVVVACALAAVVLLLNRGILRSLGGEPAYAAEIATRIADNDLAVVVHTRPDDRGSLLYSMKRMQEQLAGTISSIKFSAESIASATSQIAAGNQDLSHRTEEQAASLQERAASMEELTSTVNQNIDNARQASQVAAQAMDVAERGSLIVSQVVETMAGINASSDNIADIVGIIESIAFQTNILALNAAVEAARAGQQGRGFAVVASEVRSLAQRSSTASKEIKELIVDSIERVKGGVEFVQTAGETMNEITRSVQRVRDIMGEIAAASIEQGKGIGQVSQAVVQMDSVTQQNAALVEQAAAAASSLEAQADGLRSSVARFRLA